MRRHTAERDERPPKPSKKKIKYMCDTRTLPVTSGLVLLLASLMISSAANARVSLADLQQAIQDLTNRVDSLEADNEALREENEEQQSQIDLLLTWPDLRNKGCPPGLAVIGIDGDGELVCAAVGGGELGFTCVVNYDQSALESEALAYLDATRSQFEDLVLPSIVGDLSGIAYEIHPDLIELNGLFQVSAPLVDLNQAMPCADAVVATVVLPDITVTGDWAVDSVVVGSVQGEFEVQAVVTAEVRLTLSSPDLSSAAAGQSFDREVESVTVAIQSPSFDIQISGGGQLGQYLDFFMEFAEGSIVGQIEDQIATLLADDLELWFAAAVPAAPVTIEVTLVP